MNREIKFRAWDTIKNRMVFDPYKFHIISKHQIQVYEWKGDHIFFEDWRDLEDGIERPCFLMQYTCLKDKNSKEIYEGDICLINPDDDSYKDVVIKDKNFIELSRYKNRCVTNCSIYENSNDVEVIGNIYENPELLNSK